MRDSGVGRIDLDKYEALGNDFLVLVDHEGGPAPSAALASALCDRRRGIGADGLIRLTGGPAAFAMELWNADGSTAETSGNGLRCAALAAYRESGSTAPLITTAAAASHCTVKPEAGGGRAEVRVEMGEVRVAEVPSPLASRRAFAVDIGNPHLVLVGERGDVTIEGVGPGLERAVEGGQNVELVSVLGRAALDLEVYERGAGITEACGSGSAAAAAATHAVGLTEAVVVVRNPGGDLTVELSGSPPSAALSGPARHVAAVVVELEEVGAFS